MQEIMKKVVCVCLCALACGETQKTEHEFVDPELAAVTLRRRPEAVDTI
jgi:hypothetical protein